MRHYELMLLVHPDYSEQVSDLVDEYRKLIMESGGKVHRFEDWGRRPLAYRIERAQKGHYLLFNIECDQSTLSTFKEKLDLSEFVLRYLVVRTEKAETEPTPYLIALSSKRQERSGASDRRGVERGDQPAGDEPEEETPSLEPEPVEEEV
ncbi:MAG: 30S ribosomal protein S6 [Gammaproteobacteria bacterium AqS3]|nr:30S ribosomal protein S6 [Gammaproteobacteria bacterium AqS3]